MNVHNPNGAAVFHAVGFWNPLYTTGWQTHPIFENKCNPVQRKIVFDKFNEILKRYHTWVIWANLSWYILVVSFGVFVIMQISPRGGAYVDWVTMTMMSIFLFVGPFCIFCAVRYSAAVQFRKMLQEMRSYGNSLDGRYDDLRFTVTPTGRGPWLVQALQQFNNDGNVQYNARLYHPAAISGYNFPRLVVISSNTLRQSSISSSTSIIQNIQTAVAVPAPIPTVTATAITSPSSSLLTGGGLVNELQQLSDLHKSGALSDSEYEAAKSKLLSGTPSVVSDGNNSTQHIPQSSLL